MTIKDVNRWFTLLFYGTSALVGSFSSFLLHGALMWAVFRLSIRSFLFKRDKPVELIALACATYPISELISVIANGRGMPGLEEVIGQIVFLAILPVTIRLRLNDAQDILESASFGAAIGGILSLAFILVQIGLLNFGRGEAGFGNPGILAVGVLTFSVVILAAYPHVTKGRVLLQIGLVCALAALLLSGMRAVWLAAPLAMLLSFRPSIRTSGKAIGKETVLMVLATMLLLALLSAPIVYERIAIGLNDLMVVSQGKASDSLSHRLALWHAGWAMFLNSPIFGYGPDTVSRMTGATFNIPESYTHFHNFAITALIRGGIVELVALLAIPVSLIVVALKTAENPIHRSGQMLLVATAATFYVPSLFGILFDHDIMNAMFVYTLIVALSLGGKRTTQRSEK